MTRHRWDPWRTLGAALCIVCALATGTLIVTVLALLPSVVLR